MEKQINLIKSSKIFLTQLEVPKDVTLHCLKTAKENGCMTILNPAPASEISKEFYNNIDFFTPNETEAEYYTGIKITNDREAKQAAVKLINLGIKKVIITLGEKGLFYSDGKEEIYLKASSVKAIDTTGAGDAFLSGLISKLITSGYPSNKLEIDDCIKFASVCGLLTCLGEGAIEQQPDYEKVNKFLGSLIS